MTLLQHIKFWAVMLVVGLFVGVGGSWAVQKSWHSWQNSHKAEQSAKTTGKNIVAARKSSDQIDTAVAKGNAKAAAVRDAAGAHLAAQATARDAARSYAAAHPDAHPETPNETSVVDPSAQLDVATVRLLNDARAGSAAGATPGGDAAGAASSGVDVSGLVDADIDAAARYNELATRHNALVDWVDGVLKTQASHP